MDLEKIRAAFWHDGEIGEDYAAELIKEVDILRAEIAQLTIQAVDRGESFKMVSGENAALTVRKSREAAAYMQGHEEGRESMREKASEVVYAFLRTRVHEFIAVDAAECVLAIPTKEPK